MRRIIPALTVLLCLLLAGCQTAVQPTSRTEFMLDTFCTVTVYDNNKALAAQAVSAALDRCRDLESLLSVTREGSDIDNINTANGQPVTISDDTLAVLRAAIPYTQLSNGQFDITAGRVTALWNFSATTFELPNDAVLAEALATVGIERLHINGNTVTLDGNAQLDLGGAAKGYIADEMVNLLRDMGITSALVNLGGNIATVGHHPDGRDFAIGIKKPFTQTDEIVGTLSIDNLSVVTAGIDERGATVDGIYRHHIIDLTTGYPAERGLQSVTIIAPQSVDCDLLSTVCFLLGEADGLALIESLPDTEAVFIRTDGEVVATSGIGSVVAFEGNG